MNISIQIDDGNKNFAPGDTITGEVHWDGLPADVDSVITVELAFHTEGKGTSQREVYEEREWTIASADGKQSFTFEAPAWPWSFSGKLVAIVWGLDAWNGDDHAQNFPVTISPGGEEMKLYRYGIDEMKTGRLEKMFNRNNRSFS